MEFPCVKQFWKPALATGLYVCLCHIIDVVNTRSETNRQRCQQC